MKVPYWFTILAVLTSLLKTDGYERTLSAAYQSVTSSPFPETHDDAPCTGFRPAGSDFQTLDLIAVYQLDHRNATGVTLVQGSQGLQKAYRIADGAKLTKALKDVFPSGLPQNFGVVGTFNAYQQRRPWSLVQARSDGLEFSLTLLPVSQRMAVVVQGERVYFRCPQLFRSGWHKIQVSIFNHTVRASVDCKQLEPQTVAGYDFSNVTTVSIVSNDDGSPAPIDLQWLSMSCDSYNLTTESCKEIEAPESLTASGSPPLYGLQATSLNESLGSICNTTCHPGPMGPEGLKGNQGERGFTGLPGIRGRDGNPGPVGAQGLKGDKGERGDPGRIVNASTAVLGQKGDKGEMGERGEPGEAGLVGLAGLPGNDGRDGARGPPGPVGPPGAPGIPGIVPSGISSAAFQGAKGDRGTPGRDGSPGIRGIPGADGARGVQGQDGDPGVAGLPGQRGPAGPQGERGDIGPEGPQGPEGPRGQQGPPGPSGLIQGTSTSGDQGPPGENGAKGEPSMPGLPGRDGINGIPGSPGQRGPPGLPAPILQPTLQAPSITEKELQNICEDLIRARFEELTAELMSLVPTVKVKRGPPGRPGPVGTPGSQGEPGSQGPRGYPGQTGEPGHPGSPGANGSKGDKGDRGPEGVGLPGAEGPRGVVGPIGPPGVQGSMGGRGDPGREGAMGPRGVPGPRGSCDCPEVSFYAYAPQMNNKGPS